MSKLVYSFLSFVFTCVLTFFFAFLCHVAQTGSVYEITAAAFVILGILMCILVPLAVYAIIEDLH